MEKLLIIDGNSLVHRAFHALPPLSTTEGLPSNAVYGFTTMLLKILDSENPRWIAVAFDKGKTFRHEAYKEYKAHRPAMPDDLRPQFPLVKEVLKALRIPIFEMEGYEADDLIGAIVHQWEHKGFHSLILTGDKDAIQLVSPYTQVILTKKGISQLQRYDETKVYEEYGIAPAILVDFKGLTGDPSDNVPGVPGIGPKTATKLLQRYGSIDAILSHLDELPKHLRKQLQTFGDQALMSRSLVTIERTVPGLDVSRLPAWPGPDIEKTLRIFKKLEFRSLIHNFLPKASGKQTVETGVVTFCPPFRELTQEQEVQAVLDTVNKDQPLAVVYDGNPEHLMGLAIDGKCYVIDLNCIAASTKEKITRFLGLPEYPKTIHNGKQALKLARQQGWDLRFDFDTMVAAYLLNPSSFSPKLDDIALNHLDLVLPEDGLAALAAKAETVRRLRENLTVKIREQEQERLFYEIEMPLVNVLADMEITGIRVDQPALQAMSNTFGARIEELAQEIYDLAGEPFNINSPRQLGYILFEKLKLPVKKKTKTGYSTDASVLEALADTHEIVAKLIEHRQLVKLKGTYTEGLANLIGNDGKLHTTFHQTATATGRLSSAEPNLQNIPIRHKLGRKIRSVFIADTPDNVLLAADYSQIELRIMAHLSKDPALINAFKNNEDIHTRTAAEVFNVSKERVTPDLRSRAKAVNFGIIYGISDFGLARDLKVSRKKAKEYINAYFRRLPGVKAYIDRSIKEARECGYVTTLLNRRRYLPELFSPNKNVRNFGERAAINTPIQGSAADIIKLAMIKIFDRLNDNGFKTKMVLQVHDELIFDVPKSELEEVVKIVRQEMEHVVALEVPLTVDLKVGPNWYEVQKI